MTILIAGLTMALGVVFLRPVRLSLEKRELGEFQARSDLAYQDVAVFFEQSVQLAQQIPSRTRIREELVAYLNGDRTYEWYRHYTEPKLKDPVLASPELVAVYRYGPDGEPIVGAFVNPEDLPAVRSAGDSAFVFPTMNKLNGQDVICVQIPIRHAGFGLAGFDIIAISVSALKAAIRSTPDAMNGVEVALVTGEMGSQQVHMTGSGRDPAAVCELMEGFEPEEENQLSMGQEYTEVASNTRYFVMNYAIRDGWRLVLFQPKSELLWEARREVGLLVSVVLVLGLAATLVALIVLRFLSRRTLAETGELSQIVAEQTQELELLMREIHHRVKNDINLIRSFLSLKSSETAEPEAQNVLAEAQHALDAMARVYRLLHETGEFGTVHLKPLVEEIAEYVRTSLGDIRTEVVTRVADIAVPRKTAIPMGIIVNELLMNAVKYGTDGADGLGVTVSIVRNTDEPTTISVQNDGPPFKQQVLAGEYGFGLKMIHALATQYEGSLTLSNEPLPTVTVTLEA